MDEGESTERVLFSGAFLLFTLASRSYSTVWPVDKYSLQLIHCTEGNVGLRLVSYWISKLHPFILLCRRKAKIPDEEPQAPRSLLLGEREAGAQHTYRLSWDRGGVLPGAWKYRCGLWVQLPSVSRALSFLGHKSLNQQQWINQL